MENRILEQIRDINEMELNVANLSIRERDLLKSYPIGLYYADLEAYIIRNKNK